MSEDHEKNESDLGVISDAAKLEANEGHVLVSMRVDSAVGLGDLDSDEYKFSLVASLFKKVMHPRFRPSVLQDLKGVKFWLLLEVPEGVLEDTVLAGLADTENTTGGFYFKYNTKKSTGLSKYATQVVVKKDSDE